MEPSEKTKKFLYNAIAYVTIIHYVIILSALIFTRDVEAFLREMLIIFAIGVSISIVSSTLVMRHATENQSPLNQTLIKLAICHVPAVISFILSLRYFF